MKKHGFTMIELTVATSLTVVLALMLSSSWVMLNRPTASLAAWGQLFQEMDLAVAAITRDLGGSLPEFADTDNFLGQKRQGLLLGCRKMNDLNGDHLQLCFDGADPDNTADWSMVAGDTVIDYYVDGNTSTLVRKNLANNKEFRAASNLDSMTVIDDPNDSNNLRVEMTFQFPNYIPKDETTPLTRTCVLIVKKQP
jgi:prepilin-type N-terminal cleavage/methylation domain-containing protein